MAAAVEATDTACGETGSSYSVPEAKDAPLLESVLPVSVGLKCSSCSGVNTWNETGSSACCGYVLEATAVGEFAAVQ
jgi:hypothetical protein